MMTLIAICFAGSMLILPLGALFIVAYTWRESDQDQN